MKRIKILFLSIFLLSCMNSWLYAADDKSPAKDQAKKAAAMPVKEEKKQMTKEELSTYIKELLDHRSDILGFIPEIKKETGADGKVSYLYKDVKIEDMDKDQLHKVLNRINGEMGRINTERLQKQLQTIRQADQANRTSQQAARQVNIPQPPPAPTVYLPPQPPCTPSNVTQPPKAPTAPPTPPRR